MMSQCRLQSRKLPGLLPTDTGGLCPGGSLHHTQDLLPKLENRRLSESLKTLGELSIPANCILGQRLSQAEAQVG